MKGKMKLLNLALLMSGSLFIQHSAVAQIGPGTARAIPTLRAVEGDTTTVNVTGTILSTPPCKINGDVDLTYDFKTVVIETIPTGNYQITKVVPITCTSAPNPSVNFTLSGGAGISGKDNILTTGQKGLGIALFNGDNNDEIKLGDAIKLTLSAGRVDFSLKAVVVNYDNSELKAGTFSTFATLTTSYN